MYLRTAFIEVGGFKAMEVKYMQAIPEIRDVNSTCGMPRDDAFHLLRDLETGDHPWLGIVLQAVVGCLWYVCCDQVRFVSIPHKTFFVFIL